MAQETLRLFSKRSLELLRARKSRRPRSCLSRTYWRTRCSRGASLRGKEVSVHRSEFWSPLCRSSRRLRPILGSRSSRILIHFHGEQHLLDKTVEGTEEPNCVRTPFLRDNLVGVGRALKRSEITTFPCCKCGSTTLFRWSIRSAPKAAPSRLRTPRTHVDRAE